MRNDCNRVWDDSSIREMATAEAWKEIIDYCSGSSHSDYTRMWSLAMTSHYGPTGLHVSRYGADGRPDMSKCADVPEVFSRMREAQHDILRTMGMADTIV